MLGPIRSTVRAVIAASPIRAAPFRSAEPQVVDPKRFALATRTTRIRLTANRARMDALPAILIGFLVPIVLMAFGHLWLAAEKRDPTFGWVLIGAAPIVMLLVGFPALARRLRAEQDLRRLIAHGEPLRQRGELPNW